MPRREDDEEPPPLIGISDDFVSSVREVELYARYGDPADVLVFTGATGVGKGHLAEYFHRLTRPDGPLVYVPGGALVDTLYQDQLFGHRKGAFTGAISDLPGAFERGAGGTVVLDELPHWSRLAQQGVLDALQRRRFLPLGATREIRLSAQLVVCSTRPLATLLAEGVLIEDLFYRLGDNGVAIAPLGERRADAVALAYYYLELRRAPLDPGTSGPRRFAWPAIERLLAFDWPGNARQVANAVAYAWPRAAAVRAQLIEVAHLAPYLQALHDARVRIRAEDLAVVAQWAREYAGDRREAAVLLDRHPNTYDKYVRRGVATVASHDS